MLDFYYRTLLNKKVTWTDSVSRLLLVLVQHKERFLYVIFSIIRVFVYTVKQYAYH